MTDIDLLPNEIEEDLRDSIRSLLESKSDSAFVSSLYDDPNTDTSALDAAWAEELGLAALLVPEELDGAGATISEAAVVSEEIGRAVAPVRFFSSAVVATTLAVHLNSTDLVNRLANGEAFAAVACPATSATLESGVTVTESGDSAVVSGTVPGVIEAAGADELIVVSGTGDETIVASVAAADAQTEAFLTLDQSRRLADVTFNDAPARVLGRGAQAADAVRAATIVGRTVLAAEQYGVAQRSFDLALAYIKERRQFGRTIGSYQAIKHRMADLWLAVSQAGATVTYAARVASAWQAGEETIEEAELCSLVAASYASTVAVDAAEEAVQMHGGNGMTWEFPLHLYLKRAKADELILGHPAEQRRELAPLIDITLD